MDRPRAFRLVRKLVIYLCIGIAINTMVAMLCVWLFAPTVGELEEWLVYGNARHVGFPRAGCRFIDNTGYYVFPTLAADIDCEANRFREFYESGEFWFRHQDGTIRKAEDSRDSRWSDFYDDMHFKGDGSAVLLQVRSGWPVNALAADAVYVPIEGTNPPDWKLLENHRGAWVLGNYDRGKIVPITPVVLRSLFGASFWALVAYFAPGFFYRTYRRWQFWIVGWRGRRRMTRNECPACGYPMSESPKCVECGAPVQEWKSTYRRFD